jgi:hypothetical protein
LNLWTRLSTRKGGSSETVKTFWIRLLSKLKDTTEQYDKLFSILVNIEKKYKELMRYGRDVCPEALQGVKLKDTKKIAYFKNNESFMRELLNSIC